MLPSDAFWKRGAEVTAEQVLRRKKKQGHEWVQYVIHRTSRPRSKRVQIAKGVYGEVVGPLGGTAYMVDVKIDDMLKAYDAARQAPGVAETKK